MNKYSGFINIGGNDKKCGAMVRLLLLPIFIVFLMLPVCGSGIKAYASFAETGDLLDGPQIEFLGKQSADISDDAQVIKNGVLLGGYASSRGDHYKYLSDDEKLLYDALYGAVSAKKYVPYELANTTLSDDTIKKYEYIFYTGTSSFYESKGRSEFYKIYNRAKQACVFDHPDKVELYMCWPSVGTYYYYEDEVIVSKADYMVFEAGYDDTKFAGINAQTKSALNTMVSDIRTNGLVNSNNAVTELGVHDYYCSKVDYDHDATSSYYSIAHTAWGALYSGKAVCDGYSLGYEMILDALDIEAMVIAGQGNGGGHAWNIVKLDGRWYEVDTTWDGQTSKVYHDFFNRTTADFEAGIIFSGNNKKQVHSRVENANYSGYRMPVALGTHYTYEYLTTTGQSEIVRDTGYVEVLGISLPKTNISLTTGESYVVSPVFAPENANNQKFTVKSSNANVVTVNGNTITARQAGTATITVTSDENRINAYLYVTVNAALDKAAVSGNEEEKHDVTAIDVQTGNGQGIYKVKSGASKEVIYEKNTGSSKKVIIPASVTDEYGNTYAVTEIAVSAFKNNKDIKSVEIPSTVSKIGKNCFKKCKNLKKITIKTKGDVSVGKGAFSGINKKAKIVIKAKKKKTFNLVVNNCKKSGAKNVVYRYAKIK
ncbi:MAG: hypothetical protein E7301_02990 [Butyrivibrio sp.]|nr:hypothetical protein [Butyrivibrio sp.]